MQKGNISVQTENIFPIIKKFLYSDQEIFLRELISNAVDATTKLKTLSSRGEVEGELGDLSIQIMLDKEAKTITIRDHGIGLTEDEMNKYLNQVAFSSAQEFLDKYQNEASIIGHFGLGFYSAFMVANQVEVNSLSYQKGATAAKWTCDGNPQYTIEPIEKAERGTDIVLHIGEDAEEFLETSRIQQLLDKYAKFLPVPIQFGTKTEYNTVGEGEEAKEVQTKVPNFVNDTHPAWKKNPNELTDEDYKAFYQQLYPYSAAPSFWIHLNIEYPFNLTGILYFPKLNNSLEIQKNKIQLYSNQVYVTDEVKEIVPEFLTLLHGVIDSPDIPLNVSRSYLQSDANVRKINAYITKKVAEKLQDLFNKDRQDFENKWPEIGTFVKYGMLSDDKFQEKAAPFVLLKNTDGQYFTIEEYKEKVKENQTDKNQKITCIYTHPMTEQSHLVEGAKKRGYDVLEFDTMIDNHFIQHMEHKMEGLHFVRIDAETLDKLVEKDEKAESVLSEAEVTKVKTLFEQQKKDSMTHVLVEPMNPDDMPVVITRPEFMRRMKEMQALQGMKFDGFPDSYQIVVNSNHPLIAQKLLNAKGEKQNALARHLVDLALINQGMLKGADLANFVERSLQLMK
ncbi:MAG: molecular chaperone HtpG [Saprospiraceae bacterium]